MFINFRWLWLFTITVSLLQLLRFCPCRMQKALMSCKKTRRIACVLSRSKMETIAPDSALASSVNHLSTLDLEVYICSPIFLWL
jgi:hypothetical protein